jgi:hypothetical protein
MAKRFFRVVAKHYTTAPQDAEIALVSDNLVSRTFEYPLPPLGPLTGDVVKAASEYIRTLNEAGVLAAISTYECGATGVVDKSGVELKAYGALGGTKNGIHLALTAVNAPVAVSNVGVELARALAAGKITESQFGEAFASRKTALKLLGREDARYRTLSAEEISALKLATDKTVER